MSVLYFKAFGSEKLLFTKVAFDFIYYAYFVPSPSVVGGERNVFGLSV